MHPSPSLLYLTIFRQRVHPGGFCAECAQYCDGQDSQVKHFQHAS